MKSRKLLKLPSREEAREKLKGLVEETLSPGEASNWATPFVVEEHEPVKDFIVWKALDLLSGADLIGWPDRPYLHGQEDFIKWLAEFDAECEKNPIRKPLNPTYE